MNIKIIENPKIAIVGASAIGSLVGALLAHQGQDVTLVAKKAHAEAIQHNGLYFFYSPMDLMEKFI